MAPVVALNPAEGVQVYEVPPVAVSVAEAPKQMVGELTVMGVKEPQLMVAVPMKLSGSAVVCEL